MLHGMLHEWCTSCLDPRNQGLRSLKCILLHQSSHSSGHSRRDCGGIDGHRTPRPSQQRSGCVRSARSTRRSRPRRPLVSPSAGAGRPPSLWMMAASSPVPPRRWDSEVVLRPLGRRHTALLRHRSGHRPWRHRLGGPFPGADPTEHRCVRQCGRHGFRGSTVDEWRLQRLARLAERVRRGVWTFDLTDGPVLTLPLAVRRYTSGRMAKPMYRRDPWERVPSRLRWRWWVQPCRPWA